MLETNQHGFFNPFYRCYTVFFWISFDFSKKNIFGVIYYGDIEEIDCVVMVRSYAIGMFF